jgi:hypothetical protein
MSCKFCDRPAVYGEVCGWCFEIVSQIATDEDLVCLKKIAAKLTLEVAGRIQ